MQNFSFISKFFFFLANFYIFTINYSRSRSFVFSGCRRCRCFCYIELFCLLLLCSVCVPSILNKVIFLSIPVKTVNETHKRISFYSHLPLYTSTSFFLLCAFVFALKCIYFCVYLCKMFVYMYVSWLVS